MVVGASVGFVGELWENKITRRELGSRSRTPVDIVSDDVTIDDQLIDTYAYISIPVNRTRMRTGTTGYVYPRLYQTRHAHIFSDIPSDSHQTFPPDLRVLQAIVR